MPVAYGVLQVQNSALATDLGIFAQFMGSPLQLVIPLIATWLGCSALYEEIGHRFVANFRPRLRIRSFLAEKFFQSTLVPFVVFGGSVIFISLIAFWVWPMIGNPFISPSVYHETISSAAIADTRAFSYSQLMAFGTPAYCIGYAAWFGLGAAMYGALGAASLLLIQNRAAAILLPMAVYLIETICAALMGTPHAGLMYSLVPFGLQQAPAFFAALPTLILAVVVFFAWRYIRRRVFELRCLI